MKTSFETLRLATIFLAFVRMLGVMIAYGVETEPTQEGNCRRTPTPSGQGQLAHPTANDQ
jgi:hypothetical protein